MIIKINQETDEITVSHLEIARAFEARDGKKGKRYTSLAEFGGRFGEEIELEGLDLKALTPEGKMITVRGKLSVYLLEEPIETKQTTKLW